MLILSLFRLKEHWLIVEFNLGNFPYFAKTEINKTECSH